MKKLLASAATAGLVLLGVLAVPTPALASGVVEGTITSSATNAPIENAVISFFQPTSVYNAYTDANGDYSVAIPNGTYTVRFTAAGFATEHWQNSYPLSGATQITVTEGSTGTYDAALDDAAVISGTVTDFENNPVNLATVYAYTSNNDWNSITSVITDANGDYSLDTLAPGDYKIYVTSGDSDNLVEEWYSDQYDQATATVITFASPGESATADVQLIEGSTIEGTVTNSIGSPLDDIDVVTSSSQTGYPPQDSTTGDGSYSIPGLLADDYTLTTSDELDFFAPQTAGPISTTLGEVDTVDFVLEPSIPDPSEFADEVELVSGPVSVTAGETHTWTVSLGGEEDVYAILYSDPVYLGAGTRDDQNFSQATLTLTIPASTDAGIHRLTFSSYSDFGFITREYLDLQVAAAPVAALPSTGAGLDVPLGLAVLSLLAGAGAVYFTRRRLTR